MDFEEWVVLPVAGPDPDDGCLDFHDDSVGGRKIFRGVNATDPVTSFSIRLNHFEPESDDRTPITPPPANPKVILRDAQPVRLYPAAEIPRVHQDHHVTDGLEQVIQFTVETNFTEPPSSVKTASSKKTLDLEDQFVDMEMNSTILGSRGILLPQMDHSIGSQLEEPKDNRPTSAAVVEAEKDQVIAMTCMDSDVKDEAASLNLWKLSAAGIGALCSMGFAAATLCIVILGRGQHNNHAPSLRFQIYTDDKRMKQVVHHHQANRLNETMSAVRGGPWCRAQITFGGYYDGF